MVDSPKKYKIIREIVRRIASYKPERAYLIGSYARGEADELSDVDLVVIKKTRESFFGRMRSVVEHLNLERAIDVFVYTPAEFEAMLDRGNAFAEMVRDEGVLIYGQ